MASISSRKRIMKEVEKIKKLKDNKDSTDLDYYAELVDDNDITKFYGYVNGPKDSHYENLRYKLQIKLPKTYPMDPLEINFITGIYHPNVNSYGSICLDILKKGAWSPSQNILSVLKSIQILLQEPNANDPLCSEAARDYKNNPNLYKEKVLQYYKRNL